MREEPGRERGRGEENRGQDQVLEGTVKYSGAGNQREISSSGDGRLEVTTRIFHFSGK